MDIKLLKAFLTAAELRHFSRAADALHVTQPALSKQIGALEASLGGRLFERGRHGAELTAFGEAFLADAQALVRDADDILARAREAAGGRRGQLRIGICISVLTVVPKLIAEFRRLHPHVGIALYDLSSAEQSRRIAAGKLDVGFMRLPAAEGLASVRVVEETLALAAPAHAGLERLPRDLASLNALGFISLARGRGPGLSTQIDHWCNRRNFVPQVTQHAQDIQSLLTSVAAGVGVAFIPSRAEHLLRDATVLPLPGRDAKWSVGLAWRAGTDDAVTARFVAYMRAALREIARESDVRSAAGN
ncbi:LysR substrate-binding domain-containing protein [Trinickia caryophylli]|uniref:Transcriptional regulator, LysR family n=1 Tax=Trinickia caryophylli TaxID=28094 RepID=A0A1X7G2C9_TRICW|nr:LysR substrate-binding domain-containing protein [Trinickia caryophylli]PMS13698.1 LysR family transcriptional regulator [Trinickia caryophylli]TRX14190.1 LysR family transcriptional regulator [Trinickia caryophylli]WQE15713.1 LysR substrate-binding domain-containing protein [Trinickia caryophylli]SMF62708.1 transcriptional regulator, LysR family [Trinickia caryophylli]GLU33500.1 LysR family transcriptional regulator [Trinickia caryophylli]